MKIIAWVIVIFVVLLALRIVNLRNARARRASETAAAGGGAAKSGRTSAAPMVRCVRCGIYLPRDEAREVRGGYTCIGGECASHA